MSTTTTAADNGHDSPSDSNPSDWPRRHVQIARNCTYCSSPIPYTRHPPEDMREAIRKHWGEAGTSTSIAEVYWKTPTGTTHIALMVSGTGRGLPPLQILDKNDCAPIPCWVCLTGTVVERIEAKLNNGRKKIPRQFQWYVSGDEDEVVEQTMQMEPYVRFPLQKAVSHVRCSGCGTSMYFSSNTELHDIWVYDNGGRKPIPTRKKVLVIGEDKVELVAENQVLPTACGNCPKPIA